MVGKNNKQEQLRKNATKNTHFSLKKLSVGVASVAVGASLLVGNVAHAQNPLETRGQDGTLPKSENTVVRNDAENNGNNGASTSISVSAEQAVEAQQNRAARELESRKAELLETLHTYDALTSDELSSVRSDIENATTDEQLDLQMQLLAKIQGERKNDLEEYKKEILSTLGTYDKLTQEELNSVRNDIKAATTHEQVKAQLSVLAGIQNNRDKDLKEYKAEILGTLSTYDKLTQEELDSVRKDIEAATTHEQVKAQLSVLAGIQNERTEKGQESGTADISEEEGQKLDVAKAGALEDINGLDYYTADEKAALEDLVNEVTTFDEFVDKVDAAVSKAIEENDARHQLHKRLVETELAGNPNKEEKLPSEANKEDLAKWIKEKREKEAGNKEQGSKANERLELARKAELERLSKAGLSKERTEELRKKFLAATSMEELARLGALVDKEATQDPTGGLPQNDGTRPAFSQKELDKLVAEERAKREAEIQKLPNLTQDQKDQLIAGLKKATTVDELDAILGKAKELNAAQPAKQEEKKEEKKQGERLPDTATGAWALGLVGASSILAGAGIKKFKK